MDEVGCDEGRDQEIRGKTAEDGLSRGKESGSVGWEDEKEETSAAGQNT